MANTPIVRLRMKPQLKAAIVAATKTNFSQFIREACAEKMERQKMEEGLKHD